MAEATKRPWGYVHHKGLDKHLVGATLENVAIVEDRHGNPKENADLIVRAVNAHDALVAALTLVAYRYESGDIGDLINDMPEIEAALEAAK